MFNYIWPIGLVVLANTIYQICSKSVPQGVNPFLSLVVTYLVAACFSGVMFVLTNKEGSFVAEFGKLNWASFTLGLAIVGLELGFMFAYRNGWPVSTAAVVESVVLGIVLLFVGYFIFKEGFTWNKVLGIVICLVGLGIINYK